MAAGDRAHALVLGGGVIGGAVALELAHRGWKVTLVDKGGFGQEASTAAGGMLCPGAEVWDRPDWPEIFARSGDLYAGWVAALEEESQVAVHRRVSGLLRLAPDEAAGEAMRRDGERADGRYPGLRPTFLSAAQVRAEEPAAADGHGGLLFATDGQLRPPALLRALRVALARAGATVHEGVPALALLERAGRVVGARTSLGDLGADLTVVAAGAWSGALVRPWLALPVAAYRGQMADVRADGLRVRRMLAGPGLVLPRQDGTFTVGVTLERSGFDRTARAGDLSTILANAVRTVPQLARAAFVRTWAGVRPGTPDERPLIGPVPGLGGLLVATGHFTYGVFLAPVTAQITARLALGEAPLLDLTPFRPERFGAGADPAAEDKEETPGAQGAHAPDRSRR